jgi:hypothetical protein
MLLMLLCFVEANKLCTVDNNTNSSSCNKVYFDPYICTEYQFHGWKFGGEH